MEYKHFSHQHSLTLSKAQAGQQIQCHGCQFPCHDSIFACWNCNFFLHEHCGNANRYVKHPSHSLHPLVLMPSPTYCSGSFFLLMPGSSFSYSCALCEVDLHVNCAYLPPNLSHSGHQHEIHLRFSNSSKLNSPDYFCATSELKPGLYQDDQPEWIPVNAIPTTVQNTNMHQPQARTEAELSPEEVMLEISRMNMELSMAHALSYFIART